MFTKQEKNRLEAIEKAVETMTTKDLKMRVKIAEQGLARLAELAKTRDVSQVREYIAEHLRLVTVELEKRGER